MTSKYHISVQRFKLDTARDRVVVAAFGNLIQVVGASTDSAIIGVEVAGDDVKSVGVLNLQNRDYIRFPDRFSRVEITHSAQVGAWVDVMFLTQEPAPADFEYVRGQRTTVDSIATPIEIASNQKISIDGGSNPATGQITVGTTSTKVVDANPNRKSVAITNTHASSNMFVGVSGVTISTGDRLGPGESGDFNTRAELHAVVASSTAVATYFEEA